MDQVAADTHAAGAVQTVPGRSPGTGDAAGAGGGRRVGLAVTRGGPELMLAAAAAHVPPAEKHVLNDIVVSVIDGVLPNPYRGAIEVARGKRDFCRDFRRAFEVVARRHPHVCGRIDASHFAEIAWARAKMLVELYVERVTGATIQASKTWAHRVIRDWEETFKAPAPAVKPSEQRVTVKVSGPATVAGDDGFRSSALVRRGTMHEIAEDYVTEEERRRAHARLDQADAEWEKANG